MTFLQDSFLSNADESSEELRAEQALSQLPPKIQILNRIYIRKVHQRSLLSPADAVSWLDQSVIVFLRHDRVAVFAIVCGQAVAMADFVTLKDAKFHVNKVARQQSNSEAGPLPNLRTVHAFVTGTLIRIAEHGRLPDARDWCSVSYFPTRCTTFMCDYDQRPITSSPVVEFVPGRQKVWVPLSSLEVSGGDQTKERE